MPERLTPEQIEAFARAEIEECLAEMERRLEASRPHVEALEAIWAGDFPPARAWELVALFPPGKERQELTQRINTLADEYVRIGPK